MSAEWLPANERQHPPFEPGNAVAMQHGAYSPRRVDPIAGALVEAVLAQGGTSAYLRDPAYLPALWSWARQQTQADLLHAALLEHQELGGDGHDVAGCKGCVSLEARWSLHDSAALKRADKLGLTPTSRARLGRDVAAAEVDATAVFAELARQAQRQQQEHGEVGGA